VISLFVARILARGSTIFNLNGSKWAWIRYEIDTPDGRTEQVQELYRYGFKIDLDPRMQVRVPREEEAE
jgi:hypothetical protein